MPHSAPRERHVRHRDWAAGERARPTIPVAGRRAVGKIAHLDAPSLQLHHRVTAHANRHLARALHLAQ
eukprot:scaffold7878_cov126-Isochrysis_galbana.AAC.2